MRTIWAFLILLFFSAGFAGTETSFLGNYYLNVQGLTRYGTDVLRIKFQNDRKIIGEVGIDWGIGPQARTPADHEKYYNLPFEAKVLYEGKAFHFTVTVAKRTVYDFTLFFVYDRDYRKKIVGSVQVSPIRKGADGMKNTYGVIAEKVLSEK